MEGFQDSTRLEPLLLRGVVRSQVAHLNCFRCSVHRAVAGVYVQSLWCATVVQSSVMLSGKAHVTARGGPCARHFEKFPWQIFMIGANLDDIRTCRRKRGEPLCGAKCNHAGSKMNFSNSDQIQIFHIQISRRKRRGETPGFVGIQHKEMFPTLWIVISKGLEDCLPRHFEEKINGRYRKFMKNRKRGKASRTGPRIL